jgi:hypothetical protein
MVKDDVRAEATVALFGIEGGASPRSSALVLVAGVAALLSGLSGCAPMNTCSTNFRGGCVVGPPPPSSHYYPPQAPAVAPAVPAVPYGDPSTFADVDDKQCRSYGLTFGSHDYADCRIRLSAQHRGLDPNIGATTPAAGTPPTK